jgi:hypothetical protein
MRTVFAQRISKEHWGNFKAYIFYDAILDNYETMELLTREYPHNNYLFIEALL